MKIVKNYLYNAFYQIFILLVPVITIPYLSMVLGPEKVGINSFTNSVIQLFILFGGIGTNLYASRQVAFVRDDRQKLSNLFCEIVILRITIFVVTGIFFGIFMIFTREYRAFYLAQAISIIAAMLDVAWFFVGMENFAVTVLRNIVVKVATLICIFIFVKSANDLMSYILVISLSLVFGNLTLIPSLRRYLVKPKWKKLAIWKHFLPSLVLFIPQGSSQIYVLINKALLGAIVGVTVSGYFDQSDKIIKMILAIVTVTGAVMMPHVANAFAKGDHNKTKECLYNSFSFISAISMPMVLGLIAISNKFVPLFFTSKFIAVVPIMMIESVVILLVGWNNVIGMQYLLPTKQTRSYNESVCLGVLINVVLDIPMIILWGAIGAAIATVLSETTVTIYQLWSIKSQIVFKKLFRDNLKYMLSGFIMFVVICLLNEVLSVSWLSIMIEVFVGLMIYTLMLFVFKVEIINKAKGFLTK
ncbi:polysaccharide biosynthesis C-terminal domain-containing protein [Companilactobacillus insicii]|uniref:oligosaccharide flippase family protein n=1 Tax=Companilactobacillus insicii TaxID=1732567 RepID=UPI000F794FD5|nr:polysaccharide biosynthesis C-terminal domain-containing protein [Companilactobacillus insicii]